MDSILNEIWPTNMSLDGNATEVNTTADCKDPINKDYIHYYLIPAAFIAFVVSFLERRPQQHKIDEKLPCLNRRFRILMPLNFVSSYTTRLTYGISFGATSTIMLLLFLNVYPSFEVPTYAKAVKYLVNSLEVGLVFYPYFICLATDHKIVPSILGCLYVLSWFSVTLADLLYYCADTEEDRLIDIICTVPSLVCSLFVALHFIVIFTRALLNLRKEDITEKEIPFLKSDQAKYVKRLFQARSQQNVQKSWFRQKVYDWDPYFKFPTRLIITLMLSVLCLYMFVVIVTYVAKGLLDAVKPILTGLNITKVERAFNFIEKGWYIATSLAVAFTVVSSLLMLVSYKNQMKMLLKGQRDFLPWRLLPPPRNMLAASMRYSGNQIAYVLWGYFVLHILLFAIIMAFCFMIVLPIMDGEILRILEWLGLIAVGLVLVFAVIYAQALASHFLFLQDKLSPSDPYKPLALNNRRLFNNLNYFFLFYCVVLGFTTCLKRIILGVIFGCGLMSRIDRSILPIGFQSFDSGYNTWIGMLFVDFYHGNPTLVTFCNLLSEMHREKQEKLLPEMVTCHLPNGHIMEPNLSEQKNLRKRKLKTKWLLIYTLLNNPILVVDRKKKDGIAAKEDLEELAKYNVHLRNQKEKETQKKL